LGRRDDFCVDAESVRPGNVDGVILRRTTRQAREM
jgi:hypothetical protein